MPPKAIKRRPAYGEKRCSYCQKVFNVKGFGMHEKACRSRQELEEPAPAIDIESDMNPELEENDSQTQITEIAEDFHAGVEAGEGSENPSTSVGASGSGVQTPNVGDITIEYHPRSGRNTRVLSSEEFKEGLSDRSEPTEPPDTEPWRPFRSREDYEFAELAHDAALNRTHTERLIKLLQRCQDSPGSFTLRNYNDLKDSLESASKLLTPFQRHVIECEFEGEKKPYETWCRPLWSWIMDHLTNPEIVRHFEWDAQKVFRYDGERHTRVFTEPWTGNRFWDIQTSLPEDAKMLCLELYADKTRLSSFGTEQGYPVMARIVNLPVGIRNSDGIGGARVVGWLPLVDTAAEDKGRSSWVNFKRVVWHKAFYKLLESIEAYSVTGCWVNCGDGVARHIYPLVLMLAADYEEQCMMALIRGVGSLFPCPRCLIPEGKQGDLSARALLRTVANTKATIQAAREQELVRDKEDILKSSGLRDVDNIFWKINNSDPHAALSFDRLHTLPGGMFHKHLWERAQKLLTELGREASVGANNMADSVPRWRGLTHFANYVSVEFTDGSKWEDISKICVPVMRNTLGEDENGYRLLRCIRTYVELDLLASFDVHTDGTIKRGRTVAQRFAKLTNEYEKGGWNFPKMHLIQHLFDDIEAKGVTRNYSTKPFEKMHGPLGQSYERLTNFKDVGGQILRVEHHDLVLAFIHSQIQQFDRFYKKAEKYAVDAETMGQSDTNYAEGSGGTSSLAPNHVIVLGSKQKISTIESLIENRGTDPAFTSFCSRVSLVIQAQNSESADTIAINESHEIAEYRLVKVNYESMVDWRIKTDYLRCNPNFNKRPRYDFVVANLPQGRVFAQLVFVFVCRVNRRDHRLALVQPLGKASRVSTKSVDKGLSIYRWKIRARDRCEVIPIDSIVRGAVLVEDMKFKGDYFVIDTLDEDMFVRVNTM